MDRIFKKKVSLVSDVGKTAAFNDFTLLENSTTIDSVQGICGVGSSRIRNGNDFLHG